MHYQIYYLKKKKKQLYNQLVYEETKYRPTKRLLFARNCLGRKNNILRSC